MAQMAEIFHLKDNASVVLYTAASLALTFVLSTIYSILTKDRPWSGIPVITIDGLSPKQSWFQKGNHLLKKGFEEYSGGLFQIVTGTGPKIILPNRYVDELRNHNRLSFTEAFKPDFFHSISGFDGPAAGEKVDNLIQDTVRIKLTQSLGLITDDLVEETRQAVHDIFGEDREWHTSKLQAPVLDLVARLSSRVFLGQELCRNQRWLEIAKGYTVDVFTAARELRKVPAFARFFMHWFVPACKNLRQEVRDAHILIDGEVEKRRIAAEKALAAGQKPPKTADAVGWMVEMSKGRKVDYVACQLSLSMAAIHTTTDAIAQFLMDLCEHPEYEKPLRDEVISVIREHGWSRTALYQLKLMDSFLKECQRIHRPAGGIQRGVVGKGDLILSDGTKIPSKSRVMIVSEHMNPDVYPEPFKFDPGRFMRKREEPGQLNGHQYVTLSSSHLGFGAGQHACPGRFFATNEIKIALCNLLLKYDFRLVPGKEQRARLEMEAAIMINPRAEIQLRRREEEIAL